MRKSVGAPRRSRRSLSVASQSLFYRSMVHDTLWYATNAFYLSLEIGHMEPLTRPTNCTLRSFFLLPPWLPNTRIFQQLRLTTMEDMCNRKLLVFVRRFLFSRDSSLFNSFLLGFFFLSLFLLYLLFFFFFFFSTISFNMLFTVGPMLLGILPVLISTINKVYNNNW